MKKTRQIIVLFSFLWGTNLAMGANPINLPTSIFEISQPAVGAKVPCGNPLLFKATHKLKQQRPGSPLHKTPVRFIAPNGKVFEQSASYHDGGNLLLAKEFVPRQVGKWRLEVGSQGAFLIQSAKRSFTVTPRKTIIKVSDLATDYFIGDSLAIRGELEILGGNLGRVNLSGVGIELVLHAPDGEQTQLTSTTGRGGHFYKEFDGLQKAGTWFLQVRARGNSKLLAAEHETIAFSVSEGKGYSILVQGYSSWIEKEGKFEGEDEHRRTLDYVHNIFEKADYAVKRVQEHKPSPISWKAELQNAILNAVNYPGPLFITLVGHGLEGEFLMDEGDTLKPYQLNRYLEEVTDKLALAGESKSITVVLGMCYSGSFIDGLAAPGRIIISSAQQDERSIRGPGAPSERHGEYFVSLLFRELGEGQSLAESFDISSNKIQQAAQCWLQHPSLAADEGVANEVYLLDPPDEVYNETYGATNSSQSFTFNFDPVPGLGITVNPVIVEDVFIAVCSGQNSILESGSESMQPNVFTELKLPEEGVLTEEGSLKFDVIGTSCDESGRLIDLIPIGGSGGPDVVQIGGDTTGGDTGGEPETGCTYCHTGDIPAYLQRFCNENEPEVTVFYFVDPVSHSFVEDLGTRLVYHDSGGIPPKAPQLHSDEETGGGIDQVDFCWDLEPKKSPLSRGIFSWDRIASDRGNVEYIMQFTR